eukprot:Amastigsp_a512429_3.p3 type:complete len:119 gc:universal Amastigsp_a512429_3:381-25(-)
MSRSSGRLEMTCSISRMTAEFFASLASLPRAASASVRLWRRLKWRLKARSESVVYRSTRRFASSSASVAASRASTGGWMDTHLAAGAEDAADPAQRTTAATRMTAAPSGCLASDAIMD